MKLTKTKYMLIAALAVFGLFLYHSTKSNFRTKGSSTFSNNYDTENDFTESENQNFRNHGFKRDFNFAKNKPNAELDAATKQVDQLYQDYQKHNPEQTNDTGFNEIANNNAAYQPDENAGVPPLGEGQDEDVDSPNLEPSTNNQAATNSRSRGKAPNTINQDSQKPNEGSANLASFVPGSQAYTKKDTSEKKDEDEEKEHDSISRGAFSSAPNSTPRTPGSEQVEGSSSSTAKAIQQYVADNDFEGLLEFISKETDSKFQVEAFSTLVRLLPKLERSKYENVLKIMDAQYFNDANAHIVSYSIKNSNFSKKEEGFALTFLNQLVENELITQNPEIFKSIYIENVSESLSSATQFKNPALVEILLENISIKYNSLSESAIEVSQL